MKKILTSLLSVIAGALLCASAPAWSATDLVGHDTDLFTTNPNIPAQVPNVLIVLDNTSNWSRNSEGWPAIVDAVCPRTGNSQGDAQLCAIYKTISNLNESVNVGLMELNTTSGGGAFVRYPMGAMNTANKNALKTIVAGIEVNAPAEKASTNSTYDEPFNDIFRYFNSLKTLQASGHSGISVRNTGGYSDGASSTTFGFPAAQNADACGYDYVIFIGNAFPNAADLSPAIDTAAALLNDSSNVVVNKTLLQSTGVNTDVWTRFLYDYGVKIKEGVYRHITTYTIEVCNASCDKTNTDKDQATLLKSMAAASNGKYYRATTLSAIETALSTIFSEVQSVNSVFAATTLPVSINVRGTNLNQVYIGVFRPDSARSPRWLGNQKLYKLGVASLTSGELELIDATGAAALNRNTGFVSNTATSFWTAASTFWGFRSPFPKTDVGGTSDGPDGDLVEKGGAAQSIRTVYATPDSTAPMTRNILTTSCTGASCPTVVAANGLKNYPFVDGNTAITANALGTLQTIVVNSLTAGTITGTAPSQTTTVTAVTATPHGFTTSSPNNSIVIAGAIPTLFNSPSGGSVTVASVPSTTSFTYTVTGTAPDLGSAFVSLPSYTLRPGTDRVVVKDVVNAPTYNTAAVTTTPPGTAISAVVGNANQFSYPLASSQSVAASGYSVTGVQKVTSAVWSSTDSKVTVTLNSHGYSSGDTLNMSGTVADSAFFGTGGAITNANFVISDVTTNTFKYTNGGVPTGATITSALATAGAAHGFTNGALVRVSGVTNNTNFNHTSNISIPSGSTTTFNYTTNGTVTAGSSGTGTLIAQTVATADIDSWPITAAVLNAAGDTLTVTLGVGTSQTAGQLLRTLAAGDPVAVQGLSCTKPVPVYVASTRIVDGPSGGAKCPNASVYPLVTGTSPTQSTWTSCAIQGGGGSKTAVESGTTQSGTTNQAVTCSTASATAYTFTAASPVGNSQSTGAKISFTFGSTAAGGAVAVGSGAKLHWTGQTFGSPVTLSTIAAGAASVTAGGAVYAAKDGDLTTKVSSITSQAIATGTITAANANSSDPNERTHLINWMRGKDNKTGADENGNSTAGDACDTANTCDIRASVHGDVLHSRPAVINYNRNSTSSVTDDNDVYVFYGANDGMFHAIKGGTDSTGGKEQWAFVAPEFYGKLKRLRDQAPIISSSNPRDYFFDGPIGVYTLDANKDGKLGVKDCVSGGAVGPPVQLDCASTGDKVQMFVGMRRGGRTLYAFDTTDPTTPKLLWKKGCPNLGNNTGCDTGYSELGQTWSEPKLGYLNAWPDKLVLMFGAGYDPTVEDFQPCVITSWNTTSVTGIKNVVFPQLMSAANCPPAGTGTQVDRSMGRGIFIVDAADGTVLWRAGPDAAAATEGKQVTGMTFAMPADLAVMRNRSNVANRVNTVTGNENVPTGFLDRIYASDTGGQLWRVDVSSANTNNWVVTKVASIASTTGTPAATNMRKLMFSPDVVYSSDGIGTFDAIVLGSGDREHPFDLVVQNRFYMFKDRFTGTITPADLLVPATTPVTINDNSTDLFDVTTAYACLQANSTCTTAQQTAASASLLAANGWKLSLTTTGEKTIAPATTAAGSVIFNTNEPKQDTVSGTEVNVGPNAGNSCVSDLGTARQYGISFKDGTPTFIFNTLPSRFVPASGGGRFATFAGGGFLPTPVPVVVQIDGKYYQSVISGVTTTNPGGLKLQTRVRTYWYKKVD